MCVRRRRRGRRVRRTGRGKGRDMLQQLEQGVEADAAEEVYAVGAQEGGV